MYKGMSSFASVILAMVMLLQLLSTCDAAATKPPQKTVEISEPSAPAGEAEALSQEHRKSVKKALNLNPVPVPKESKQVSDKESQATAPGDTKLPAPPESESAIMPEEGVEQSRLAPEMDFPGQAVVYLLVGVTSSAILLLVLRVYRLRLSRAERKYGVHGDRANQELTPLPMAIEDVNSDEEDHTLFEVNRQNIRIL
ncbi:hypothetical protein KR074_000534 [Drosophila pseudoananassae]|nr:hypothetical protein KR074_000534 [Drosophila pseudoananassae]